MIIYEPKKYPDLNPKIGDYVYDYLTGEKLGVVNTINPMYRYIRFNCGYAEQLIRPSGLSSPEIIDVISVTSLYECWTKDIITTYSLKKTLRIRC